jgi:hypothetical protein
MDHVLEGVIVIVEENDVIRREEAGLDVDLHLDARSGLVSPSGLPVGQERGSPCALSPMRGATTIV